MGVQFEVTMQKEMPTVSTEDTNFDHNGVLDGKPPALIKAIEYSEYNG